MELFSVNPFIRYARMHTFFEPIKKDSLCYDCRLFYFLSGEGTLTIAEECIPVKENALIFLPPATRYRFRFDIPESVTFFVLNFDLTDKFHYLSHSLGTPSPDAFRSDKKPEYTLPELFAKPIFIPDGLFCQSAVENCTKLFLEKAPFYAHRASAVLKALLFEMPGRESDGNTGESIMKSVTAYVRTHYHEFSLSNEEIASLFHYHPYHLSRLIKQFTGKTLHRYLMDYRLDMAKNFLITTQLPITQIAEKCGFSSYSYFIKIFRQGTGETPLRYRKNHRGGV